MKITSPAFENQHSIPSLYTCDAKGVSPPLNFSEVPKEAKSLALIMDDPDVPASVRSDQMYVHWVVFNMPATLTGIAEGAIPPGVLGKETGGKIGYFGPCPPDREHRYFFKLYALDTVLTLKEGATKEEVEAAMAGHILASAELIGRYNRTLKIR